MFNIGGGELLVILLVALIVLGPARLPSAARQVGQFMGELRRLSSGFQQELRDALDEPLDTTEQDPGWEHRRRASSRQAELRAGAPQRDHQARPPVHAVESDGAVPEPDADPTASSGPVAAAPAAPDAAEAPSATDAPDAAEAPPPGEPTGDAAQDGDRAVG
jgi:sec-independent protein translocase protein TatB